MKHLYGSRCTEFLRPENYNPSHPVTVVGMGDPPLCREAVSALFDSTGCKDREDCSFNGVYQPKVKGKFVVSLQALIFSQLAPPPPIWTIIVKHLFPLVLFIGLFRILLYSQCSKFIWTIFTGWFQLKPLVFLRTELGPGLYQYPAYR